jgi:hypothetical protein
MPATATPRRRWFTFSLRTLLVLVTLAACITCWLAYHLTWMNQRRQAIEWLAAQEDSWYSPSLRGAQVQRRAPWQLWMLGEGGVLAIGIDREFDGRSPVPFNAEQLKSLFPEARVDKSMNGRFWDDQDR